jgi:RimJ/RimL family protein N-acetyltransferase
MIITDRLMLRRWRPEDREPYAAMMTDPEVGYWLGSTQTREVVIASMERFNVGLEANGYGFFAMERRTDSQFIGAVELADLNPVLPLAPGHELGWRLARHAWGHGYATEAAHALLRFGFDRLNFPEILAFTAVSNTRSHAVMERLGMRRDESRDFDHPALAADHPLRRHVVYIATGP